MTSSGNDNLARYARQMRYAPLGEEGQRRLAASTALIVGCGALGSVSAGTLARAGVGRLRIVDRDFVELTNLQRQMLFDEADVATDLPKAIAAAEKLRRINSTTAIEPVVADVSAANIESLCMGVDVIVDGTDNFETRFLLNDAALAFNIPWLFGGCLGSEGQAMTIVPAETPCLRCLMPDPPPPGSTPTCDTAGILAPIVLAIAAIQSQEAIKILSGNRAAIERRLVVLDLWTGTMRAIRVERLDDCTACRRRDFPWLRGERGGGATVLCGRNAVQIGPGSSTIALEELQHRLDRVARVTRNPFLLRAAIDNYVLTVFPDGRAIIGGTDDVSIARSVYAKYVGV
ncbi:MAG TPA: ThiF family adenylyltransferase [Pirellulales bacterium]|jgi:adenylyltransferase/sulfurtransferase|nr:ThiF family adenylyltransferase [Pirellulales bacterium]